MPRVEDFLRGRGEGIRRYIIVGIDVATRFGFAYGYTHLSSRAAHIFWRNFVRKPPFEIRGVKTEIS